MKSKVYEGLVSFLLGLSGLDIQLVDILKNQLAKGQDYLPNHYPAILLKLDAITWGKVTEEGLQYGEADLTVWVIQKNQDTASHAHKNNMQGKFDFLDLPERVFERLNDFVIPDVLIRLERLSSKGDVFTASTVRQSTNYKVYLVDDSVRGFNESRVIRLSDVSPSIEV